MTTIFAFWEPRGALVPYLALCMKTWERALHAYEIVLLNYENLGRYLEDGALDLETLRRLPLSMQKDAVMVAVLHRHGGLFLDVDTLAVADIAPLLAFLERSEAISFNMHLACIGARPGARLLDLWLGHIRAGLPRSVESTGGPMSRGATWATTASTPPWTTSSTRTRPPRSPSPPSSGRSVSAGHRSRSAGVALSARAS